MGPHPLLRSLARPLSLLLLTLALPTLAHSQPPPSAAPDLTPEVRARLTQAAGNPSLPEWQRQYMQGLASGAMSSTPDMEAGGERELSPLAATGLGDGQWAQVPIFQTAKPLPRVRQSAIYDPVRHRIVVFGGYRGVSGPTYFDDVWALSLEGDPTWTDLAPTGTPPAAREGHSAIYDPVRDRMLVFGGSGAAGCLNDVWVLSLAGTPAWTALAPAGTPPSVRREHSAIYDPVRDRMVVFGGDRPGNPCWSDIPYYNDVWSLSLSGTPAWTQVTPGGGAPDRRGAHSAIYDPVRDRMVIFGGFRYGSPTDPYTVPRIDYQDTWALSLSGDPAWTCVTTTGALPEPRDAHCAIYDPVRDRMLVVYGWQDVSCYAGGGSPHFIHDAWALSLSGTPTWTALPSPPGDRTYSSAIYDPGQDRMVILGGNDWGVYCTDLLALSLSGAPVWSVLTEAPSARRYSSAIDDPVGDRMVVFGGLDQIGSRMNDVWTLDEGDTPVWTRLLPAGTPPSARFTHSAICDPARGRMLVFGGYDGVFRNDIWALSLLGTPTWTQLAPTGTPPSVRNRHTAIYDPVRDRMLVFGGWSGAAYLDDVWALSLAGAPAWTQLACSGTPPSARAGHSAIYDAAADRMIVFAGSSGTGSLNDVWALSLAGTPAWTQLAPTGTPPGARALHGAVCDALRSRMVVFGGDAGTGSGSNDTWALSLLGSPAWTQLAPGGTAPSARYAHSTIYDSFLDRLWVFGGFSTSALDDAWSLVWDGNPTDVLASLVSADATAERVRLEWALGSGAPSAATVYRRTDSTPWQALGTVSGDGTRHVRYEDGAVTAGVRYGYRLRLAASGTETFAGETWVMVPVAASFALHGAQPNPAVEDGLKVRFTLPDGSRAALEVYDVRGRRVWGQEVGALGGGEHVLRVDAGARLAPGVYLVRLVRGERAITSRAVVMR